MNNPNAWNQYLNELHQLVEKQNKKLAKLEDRVVSLENQVKTVSEKPTTNIEKIEYHFDQLKVETLEGTLNIGMAPQDLSNNVEDLGIPMKQTPPKNYEQGPIREEIKNELNKYMNENPEIVNQIAEQYGKSYDRSYQHFILQDIHKQLDDRVNYYLNELSKKNQGMLNEQSKQEIVKKIQEEIHHSLHQFMKNQTKEGESP